MLKKLAINIFWVGCTVFVLDFAIGRVLRRFYFTETSGLHYRTTYSMEKTDADILIFGSSRANHHYVPEIFEDSLRLTFYNTGRDGNGIFYQVALLHAVLARYTPKLIILDYAGSFEKGQNEYDKISSLLPYYRTHPELRKVVEMKGPYEKYKLASEIYPFNSQALTIAMGNMERNRKRNPDNKGYVELHTERQISKEVYHDTIRHEVDSSKVNAFREFVRFAKQSGSRFVVVYSPLYQQLAIYPEVETCRDICLQENVPFLDYSRDPFFLSRGDLFYDPVHLNHEGAQIFSTRIAALLK